ncbi:20930_t:CDS:2, partial [Cetraspora pellucida]
LTRFRALKQKHQANAIREEIIAKFQEALTKKKTKHLRKKKRNTQMQQLLPQAIKKEITTKRGIDKKVAVAELEEIKTEKHTS